MTREVPPGAVLVGRVRRPHGVGGELLVEPLSEVEERFAPGAELDVVGVAAGRRSYRIASRRSHNLGLLLRLEGCESREEAERLRGAELEVPAASSPAAPPGAYYYYELVGCECRDRRHGPLGRVAEVREDGGGLLLAVRAAGRELLVPFVKAYLLSIDREAGVIELDLPEGLLETCASTS